MYVYIPTKEDHDLEFLDEQTYFPRKKEERSVEEKNCILEVFAAFLRNCAQLGIS